MKITEDTHKHNKVTNKGTFHGGREINMPS